jgi:hypothetical protein
MANIYVPGSSVEILNQMLNDYRLGLMDKGITDPVIFPGTEPYIRFNAIANAALVTFANIETLGSQGNETSATADHLDNIREALGLDEIVDTSGGGNIIPSIISGTVLFPSGLEFISQDGLRGKVDGNQLISNGEILNVIMIDKGSKTNLIDGSQVRWINAPVNVSETAVVSGNFSGGFDAENDAAKRARILSRRRYPPGGGNWAQLKELAESTGSGVQAAFVFPAIGGPGSSKVVVCQSLRDNSRQVNNSVIDDIQAAIQTNFPGCYDIICQSVVDDPVDLAIELTLPEAIVGGGWMSASTFPHTTDSSLARITYITDENTIRISTVLSKTSPNNGDKIAIWNPNTRKFIICSIVSWSLLSPNDWRLELNISTSSLETDWLVSPAAEDIQIYADTIVSFFDTMGPGENTNEPFKLPRSLRQPLSADEWYSGLTSQLLSDLQTKNPEIRDLGWKYRSKITPEVPVSINIAPNIFIPRNIAFYKKY